MTLNILFFTITINKREVSAEEIMKQEMANKIYEENKDRQISMHRLF